jgi:response regulator RpfG family c-di-GMP phosphodiesterase
MKILIVDDSQITIRYLQNFICNLSNHVYDFEEARNYDSARLFLDEPFDLVLCDNYLDNGKFGVDFITEYQSRNSRALCFLYSSEPEKVNIEFAKRIKCYSIDELENELVFSLENINQSIRYSEAMTMQHAAAVPMAGYNKELCTTLHDQNEKDHTAIKSDVISLETRTTNAMERIEKKVNVFVGAGISTTVLVFGILVTQIFTLLRG